VWDIKASRESSPNGGPAKLNTENKMQSLYSQFLDGFAVAAEIPRPGAERQWGAWSMEMPDGDRQAAERGGYDSGMVEGNRHSEAHRLDGLPWDSEMVTSDDW